MKYTTFDAPSKYDDGSVSSGPFVRQIATHTRCWSTWSAPRTSFRRMSWIRSSKACGWKTFLPSCTICCQACTGDALSCTRAVEDLRQLAPRTLVRAIRLVAEVKELKHVEAALDKWEEQGKVLKKDFGEEFSDIVLRIMTTGTFSLVSDRLRSSDLGAPRLLHRF